MLLATSHTESSFSPPVKCNKSQGCSSLTRFRSADAAPHKPRHQSGRRPLKRDVPKAQFFYVHELFGWLFSSWDGGNISVWSLTKPIFQPLLKHFSNGIRKKKIKWNGFGGNELNSENKMEIWWLFDHQIKTHILAESFEIDKWMQLSILSEAALHI